MQPTRTNSITPTIAGALWGAKIVNTILGNGPEGLSSQALQQGGIGLLRPVLIISVPPMMGTIFQGTVGNYLTYSVFGAGGARPGPQGQPAGMYGPGANAPPLNKAQVIERPHIQNQPLLGASSSAPTSNLDITKQSSKNSNQPEGSR